MSIIQHLHFKATFINVSKHWNQKCLFHASTFQLGHYLSLLGDTVDSTDNFSKKRRKRIKWLKEESEKLKELVDKHGPKWAMIRLDHFPTRTSGGIRSHYLSLLGKTRWTVEERRQVQEYMEGVDDLNKIDWADLQTRLPNKELGSIRKFCQDFQVRTQGKTQADRAGVGNFYERWTDEEVSRLFELSKSHPQNWQLMAQKLGKTEKQCKNKLEYEMGSLEKKKGLFTEEEDEALLRTVAAYGDLDFHKIKQAMGSKRTVQQLRYRYLNTLCPDLNREPWTEEEKRNIFELYEKHRSVSQIIANTNTKRSYQSLANKLRPLQKTLKSKL